MNISRKRGGAYGKAVVLFLLLACLVLVLLYQSRAFLAQGLADAVMGGRTGRVRVAAVDPEVSGIRFAGGYERPGIRVEEVSGRVGWGVLFGRSWFSHLHAKIGFVEVDGAALTAGMDAEAERMDADALGKLPGEAGRFFRELRAAVRSFGIETTEVRVTDGRLLWDDVEFGLSGRIRADSGGEGRLEGRLRAENDWLNAGIWLWSPPEMEKIGVDFALEGRGWNELAGKLPSVPGLPAPLREAELYLDPMAETDVVSSVSGYVRWQAEEPANVRAAVLGNLGPAELFTPRGWIAVEGVSLGVATDGNERLRGFATLPVERVRIGSWMRKGGAIRASLEAGEAGLDLRIGGDGALRAEFRHRSLPDLFAGDGEVEGAFKLDGIGADLINALSGNRLPPGMELALGADLEGSIALDQWSWRNADLSGTVSSPSGGWPEEELTWEKLKVRVSFAVAPGEGEWRERLSGFAEGGVASIGVGETVGSDVAARVEKDRGVAWRVAQFEGGIFGGEFALSPFVIRAEKAMEGSSSLRVRGIDLRSLAAVVPQFDGSISGSASGSLDLVWDGSGFRLRGGRLDLDKQKAARLSYDTGGLLTRGFEPGSSVHKRYRMAEEALRDLSLDRLVIQFSPEGGEAPLISVDFFGESEQSGVAVPVDYQLNVNVRGAAELWRLFRMMRRGELEIE